MLAGTDFPLSWVRYVFVGIFQQKIGFCDVIECWQNFVGISKVKMFSLVTRHNRTKSLPDWKLRFAFTTSKRKALEWSLLTLFSCLLTLHNYLPTVKNWVQKKAEGNSKLSRKKKLTFFNKQVSKNLYATNKQICKWYLQVNTARQHFSYSFFLPTSFVGFELIRLEFIARRYRVQ